MSFLDIRNALQARLQTISGTGIVHAYPRIPLNSGLTSGDPEFKMLFGACGVNTWMVSRVGRESHQVLGSPKKRVWHSVVLLGYLQILDKNASQLVFDGLVDSICWNIEAGDRTFGGVAKTCGLIKPAIGFGQLQDANCHLGKLAFQVEEIF